MKILFFFITLFSLTCHADVFDHLRKIENKYPEAHKMRNIDFIYLINLDKRPDKFHKSLTQLLRYGIFPYRFSAVSGWELSLEDINDVGVVFSEGMEGGFLATSYLTRDLRRHDLKIETYGQTYFVHCFARGPIGICLSHLSILKDAYDSGYETIWVMEDDINICQDPRIIPDLIDRLDDRVGHENWDVLFTDRDFKNRDNVNVPCYGYARRPNFKPERPERFALKQVIDSDFRQIGSRFGATSMIVRRSGMKKILNHYKNYQIYLPYDMDMCMPNDIQLYTVNKDVVTNLSDAGSNNAKPPS